MYITEENNIKSAETGETGKYLLVHDDSKVIIFKLQKWGMWTNSKNKVFIADTKQECLDEITNLNLTIDQSIIDAVPDTIPA